MNKRRIRALEIQTGGRRRKGGERGTQRERGDARRTAERGGKYCVI
jgi:hypothetical protein